jgi:VWFA-related protein
MTKAIHLLIIGLLLFSSSTVQLAQESTQPSPPTAKPPLTIGLLIDNSGSIRSYFSKIIKLGKAIVDNSETGDQILLVRFVTSDNITFPSDFTAQKSTLDAALDEMYVEGGRSAITDAVYVSAEHFATDEQKRGSDTRKQAIVLITDGAEENSYYTTDKLLSLLRGKHLAVYAVGFPQAVERQGPRFPERARDYLTKLTEQTGGKVYFPVDGTDANVLANSILNDIRRQ